MQGDIEGGLDDLQFHTYLPPGGQVAHVHHQLQVIVHRDKDNFTGQPILLGHKKVWSSKERRN